MVMIVALLGGLLYLIELVGRLLLTLFRAIQDHRTPRAFRTIDAPH